MFFHKIIAYIYPHAMSNVTVNVLTVVIGLLKMDITVTDFHYLLCRFDLFEKSL